MRFQSFWFIILLLALPFLYRFVVRKKPASLPHPDLLSKLKDRLHDKTIKVRLPLYLRLTAMVFLILALMRLQYGYVADASNRNGVDIMVALDVSTSMNAEDFKPDRISVAKDVLTNFINGRPQDRIGLVIFSGKSYLQTPLTTDHNTVLNYLDQIHTGMIEDGTAIGMALATSVNRLKDSEAKTKIILLLTDGENNAGEIDPPTAARMAQALGIKIYAVGIGDPNGAPVKVRDRWGRWVYARTPDGSLLLTKMNESGLREISSLSEGGYFMAGDENKLKEIFSEIDKREKTKFKVKDIFIYNEYFAWFAWPALLLLLMEWSYRRFYLRRLP
ncbi:MAG TPA: VWA domain-containing protein [Smithella sp.]|nr:VWA domain-containing protein [Smithella sp.]MDM7987934.1 VWA domain-containing protein [Smithella sp.]HNY50619.1 VWA domain-containing protein [Smithella sp.]HOG89186.1 VWA domain-containing protein [Smithella sp.]HOU49937.1 VWA domain-containing protein [Smithella sp.]